tara:strand:+ start:10544 stop:11287 length:744 start_codon:yes stop_codon:yes gene_type:complete
MAVPGSTANYLRGTKNTAYTAQTQGGTILGNTETGDAITNALALKDNSTDFGRIPYPVASTTSGSIAYNIKAQGSNGTFCWDGGTDQGERFAMMGYSTKLGNYANTAIQKTGADPSNMAGRRAIAQFMHQFGADTTSLIRKNRFSYTGFFNNGNKISSRHLFMNAAGTAIADPSTLTGNLVWAPGGSSRNGSGALASFTDVAANPTRAIPGRLVMQASFVVDATEGDPWSATRDGGSDFYDYKPING